MNNDDRTYPAASDEEEDSDTLGTDKAMPPTSPRNPEEEIEQRNRKIAEIERKVADGN
jgi:hypothetical protein